VASVSKQEMLKQVRDGYAQLDQVLTGIPTGSQLSSEGWTTADHVFHVAGWEEIALAAIEGRDDDPEIACLFEGNESGDVDRTNERLHLRHAGGNLAAARARLEDVRRRLLAVLQALPEGRLDQPWRPGDAGATIAEGVAANTYDHYPEHIAAVRNLSGAG